MFKFWYDLGVESSKREKARKSDPNYVPTYMDLLWEKWVYKPYKMKSYSSTKEMLSDRESHGFLYEIWFDIECRISRVWDWPGDRLRDLKHYHQRGIHGVSDCDCWGLYDHLLDVKIKGLEYIKKYKHGCPCLDGFGTSGEQTDEEFEAMSKEWDKIVDEMIWTFKIAKKISNHEVFSPGIDSPYFTDEDVVKWQKFCDEWNRDYPQWEKRSVLSKDDFERYKLGWNYYRNHFFSLWD